MFINVYQCLSCFIYGKYDIMGYVTTSIIWGLFKERVYCYPRICDLFIGGFAEENWSMIGNEVHKSRVGCLRLTDCENRIKQKCKKQTNKNI